MYVNDKKRVITGHGIDISFWGEAYKKVADNEKSDLELVSVHRICRSKRLEIVIKALILLPDNFSLTIYGRDVEKDYAKELYELVENEKLEKRVRFMGPVPMHKLRFIYPKYSIMVNMAWETIDKTMLEGMLFGIYPVTTKRNAKAIGLPFAPEADTPEAVASFILNFERYRLSAENLRKIVIEKHILSNLVIKMNEYVKDGK